MIIPSIDLMAGRAVQLRRGRELVLEGGDPFERLEEFSVAGEVAVVDLDAALGNGSNTDIVREMVRHAPCLVGGGIRDLDTAFGWLDAGAARVVIGTAASVDFCSRLPRDRVVAAVDAEEGTVVVEGWRTTTSYQVIDRIKELAPAVGGFLLTQVEHEGGMSGFSMALVEQAVEAAGAARVTAAGGIATVDDIASLDRLGVDAQVGMALYSGRLTLGAAVAAPLTKGVDDRLWPTVVCDESGATLGLVWSTRESLEAAVSQRRGIYWSRSRKHALDQRRDFRGHAATAARRPGLRPRRASLHGPPARGRVLSYGGARLLAVTVHAGLAGTGHRGASERDVGRTSAPIVDASGYIGLGEGSIGVVPRRVRETARLLSDPTLMKAKTARGGGRALRGLRPGLRHA